MAFDPTYASPYLGDLATISATSGPGGASQLNVAVSLLSLIQAIDPHISGAGMTANLYADPTNAAAVNVGSDRVSASNYAYQLQPGGGVRYGPFATGIPIGRIFIYCTATTKLGIEVMA